MLFSCELLTLWFFLSQHMKKTYTQNISEDNLSHENIHFTITIQVWLKKWGETLNLAVGCSPSYFEMKKIGNACVNKCHKYCQDYPPTVNECCPGPTHAFASSLTGLKLYT